MKLGVVTFLQFQFLFGVSPMLFDTICGQNGPMMGEGRAVLLI